jgi:hypothetical protein
MPNFVLFFLCIALYVFAMTMTMPSDDYSHSRMGTRQVETKRALLGRGNAFAAA